MSGRDKIIKFINKINPKLEAQLIKDGNVYETSLKSFLLEGLVIAELRFKNETPEKNIHIIKESKIQAQNEIVRLQSKIADIVFGVKNHNDNEYVIKAIRERIKVQEYIIGFLDLLHSEYLNSYFSNPKELIKPNNVVNDSSIPDRNKVNPIELEFDKELIQTDYLYRFETAGKLKRHLATIEPFAERAKWFYRTSKTLGIQLGYLGKGSAMIPEREVWSRHDGNPVDKDGQPVKEIAWGLAYDGDEEKTMMTKTYFQEYYRTHRKDFLFKPRLDFEQLRSQYATQVQTERGKRLVLEWVIGEMQDRQQLINDWITANPDRYGSPEIKRQIQNVAVLINQELEGIPAIKWGLFYRPLQLDPFALLWGLVKYKRFLEIDEMPTLISSIPPATDEPKKQRKQRDSTKKLHEQYKSDFSDFQSLEGKDRLEAIRLTADKHKVSSDTVERALGLRK